MCQEQIRWAAWVVILFVQIVQICGETTENDDDTDVKDGGYFDTWGLLGKFIIQFSDSDNDLVQLETN